MVLNLLPDQANVVPGYLTSNCVEFISQSSFRSGEYSSRIPNHSLSRI